MADAGGNSSHVFASPTEVKALEDLAADPTLKALADAFGVVSLELTKLNCGTWVFMPYFQAKKK